MGEKPDLTQGRSLVLGLTGSVGSGCTDLSKGLEKHNGFTRVALSDAIKEEFRRIHPEKEPTLESFGSDWRKKLQDIGNEGRARSSFYWAEKALDGCPEGPTGDIVIDGIRNIGEVEYLRHKYRSFWLVAVYADFAVRWKRVEADYPNEKTFARDDDRDKDEEVPGGQSVQKCVDEADYVMLNNEDITASCDNIRRILAEGMSANVELMKYGTGRGPFFVEVHMATAFSLSHASKCLKRHVGAVIVNKDEIALSVGYNENPVGMLPCSSRRGKLCYKDSILQQKMERMTPFYCPECGHKTEVVSKPWKCDKCGADLLKRFFPSRGMELCTALHAEERAIRSLGYRDAKGSTLYVNTFPCFQCARYIKDAGIKNVVYVEAYPVKEARDFFDENDIEVTPFAGFKARAFNILFKQVE